MSDPTSAASTIPQSTHVNGSREQAASGAPHPLVSPQEAVEKAERLDAALYEAELLTRAIVDTVVDGIITIDSNGTIASFNRAAEGIFQYGAAEVIGQNVRILMPEPFHSEHDGYLARYLQSREPRVIGIGRKVVGRRKDGTTFPMELAVSGTSLGDRELFTGITRDISERKNAEAALREAQKLESLGVLAGGIAHDFNNLLVGILGNAGLALDELGPESPARELLREIEVTGKRAAELARQMLAYSGKGRFVVERLDLSKLIEEMSHLLRVSVRKGVILRYNCAPGLPLAEADATQIRQVIMNLVINASDAIGDRSGVVTVSTGLMHATNDYLRESYIGPDVEEGDYVYLEVSDTGGGMAPEVRARVFDPFFTTKFTGRGLGLAVVLGVVRGHKGSIKIYSEPGHGSTFKVLFPADAQAADAAPVVAARPEVWTASGLVLIVDDDETVRTITKRALQSIGFTVLTAEDGWDGVEVFRQHQEEILFVLMDLTMPRMNGEEAFREIRHIRSDARVIIMSGYNEQETTERFVGRGLAGFIQKPYEVSALRQVVRSVIQQSGPATTSSS